MSSIWRAPHETGNNGPLLSHIRRLNGPQLLNIIPKRPTICGMKQIFLTTAAALLLATQTAAQSCFADYKAKQDDPLRLQYGVAQINGACTPTQAASELAPRLSAQGWMLLSIVSTFGPEGLEERKERAGPYYLRF